MAYIAFEGIDGSGKSTHYKSQVSRLRGLHGAEQVREYIYSAKDNPVGRLIKKVYGQETKHPFSFLTQRRIVQEVLYSLNARQNLVKVGGKSSENILVSDRSIITAYASHLGLVPEWFINFVEPKLIPELALFIDIPPEVGIMRIAQRGSLFLEENLEDLRIFRENYQKIFNDKRPKALVDTDIHLIDGNRSLEEVAAEVTEVIDGWLEKHYQKWRPIQNARKG